MYKIGDVIVGLCLLAFGGLDFRKRLLPVWLLAAFHVLSVTLCILIGRVTILSALGGMLIGGCFFLASRITREKIGYGDSWLILILGGYLGFQRLLAVAFLASLMASFVSLILCVKHGRRKDTALAFVPFLAAAYGLVVFL